MNVMSCIETRIANKRDFLRLAEIDRLAWVDNSNSEFIPDGEHIWRLWVEYSRVFVVEIDGRIIGASIMFISDDHDLLYLLHKMFVNKEYRGIGCGKLMFNEIAQCLDKCQKACMFTTDPENKGMQILSSQFGFAKARFEKSYYRDNEDRLIMMRYPRKEVDRL